MPGVHTFYDGATFLQPIADVFGVDVDKINLVLCLFASLPLGHFYRTHLSADKVSRQTRSLFPLIVGLLIGLFCFGRALKHLLANTLVSYALMKVSPANKVHLIVFVFSMSYLLWIHFYRWMILKSFSLDITGPMMVAVQKITTLAFNLYDGRGRKEEDLSDIQRKEAIREIPSVVDYLSFILNFQTILTGPINFYADYSAFLDGNHVQKDKDGKIPDPTPVALRKIGEALIYLVVLATLGTRYLPGDILTEPYLQLPYYQWCFWWYFVIFLIRFNYYFGWVLADAICNMSGFGFSGYSKDGVPQWKLCTNVDPWKVENAESFKETLDGWNILTGGWFRRVAYDRVPKNIRTLATYTLSAVWHGISVGYYMTFATGALFTLAGSTFRRCMRWRVLDCPKKKFYYDIFCSFGAKCVLAYCTYPFVAMNYEPSIFVWKRIFFLGHLMALAVMFVLPVFFPPQKSSKNVQQNGVEDKKNVNGEDKKEL